MLKVATAQGIAQVHLHAAAEPIGAVVLGHGAGGGIAAPDLVAVTGAALDAQVSVALVEQPYRVAGRRSAAPAHHLDSAWIAVLGALRAGPFEGLELVSGGRSSGARVACRTAAETGVRGVLCLAFPLLAPARRGSAEPRTSRQDELDAVAVPVLVIQGESDRFGMPEPSATRQVVAVRGDHGLKRDLKIVGGGAAQWLAGVFTTS